MSDPVVDFNKDDLIITAARLMGVVKLLHSPKKMSVRARMQAAKFLTELAEEFTILAEHTQEGENV